MRNAQSDSRFVERNSVVFLLIKWTFSRKPFQGCDCHVKVGGLPSSRTGEPRCRFHKCSKLLELSTHHSFATNETPIAGPGTLEFCRIHHELEGSSSRGLCLVASRNQTCFVAFKLNTTSMPANGPCIARRLLLTRRFPSN